MKIQLQHFLHNLIVMMKTKIMNKKTQAKKKMKTI